MTSITSTQLPTPLVRYDLCYQYTVTHTSCMLWPLFPVHSNPAHASCTSMLYAACSDCWTLSFSQHTVCMLPSCSLFFVNWLLYSMWPGLHVLCDLWCSHRAELSPYSTILESRGLVSVRQICFQSDRLMISKTD